MLFDDFEEAGLDKLIPRHTEPDYDPYMDEKEDEDYLADWYSNGDENLYDPQSEKDDEDEEDDWVHEDEDGYDPEDDDYDDDEIPIPQDRMYDTIGELKADFDMEFMSDEEFITQSAADLFGITKPQLKFIDVTLLHTGCVVTFCDMLKNPKIVERFPDIEQRIKYAEVEINITPSGISLPPYVNESQEKLQSYIDELIKHHDPQDSVEKLRLLRDYYRNWNAATVINNRREESERLHYELFPQPKKIKDMHDKAMRDAIVLRGEMDELKKNRLDEDIKSFTKSAPYRQYLYTEGQYCVVSIPNYAALSDEGYYLSHCVEQYAGEFASGNSLIYGIRETSAPDIPYFTIEVKKNPTPGSHNMELTQCYGMLDTTEKPAALAEFIRRWARLKGITIVCKI